MAKSKKPPSDPNQAAKKLIDFLDEKTETKMIKTKVVSAAIEFDVFYDKNEATFSGGLFGMV